VNEKDSTPSISAIHGGSASRGPRKQPGPSDVEIIHCH
jgi:hypothetical protein